MGSVQRNRGPVCRVTIGTTETSTVSLRSDPSPAVRRAVRGNELDCTAGVALNQNYARGHEPLSAPRGRGGAAKREGEVGGAANRLAQCGERGNDRAGDRG